MSILKAILHHYNSTSKSYDTLHPETESAQITDWHTALVNSLASSTLSAVVSTLSTDSVMGRLMKMLLTASGVKYSIGPNGYVCFGEYFGGLIIQWGLTTGGGNFTIPMNIDFSDRMLYANVINIGQLGLTVDWQIWTRNTSSFEVYSSRTGNLGWLWVAIGK